MSIINKLIILSLVISIAGCSKQKAGIYLAIDGKDYSISELYIDDIRIGKSKQLLTKPTGELYIDGKYVNKETQSPSVANVDIYSGSFEFFTVNPGKHNITLKSDNGNQIEFEKIIKPGENYVKLRVIEDKVLWNNEEYKIK